jgi:hypothetical protein
MAICALQGCNKKARRKFCCNKHKDRYHNLKNPRGKFAHLNPRNEDQDPYQADMDYYYETTHPFSGEALGQD